MTLERKVELLEQAVCMLIDCISPMHQDIRLSSLKTERLEAICNELKDGDNADE